jgi:Alpha-galactosidases/6-phospho-beta-glucosidases, family 4 of glycosyl hydrolases
MSEYTPYFRKNSEAIKALKVDKRWWLAHEMAADEYFEELKSMLDKNEEIPISKTFEYAPEIIHALESDKPFRANLNVLNRGIISNLPADSVVEVPCYADNMGIHPCHIGELPEQLAALNRSNINVHIMMAKAAIEKKKELIYQAVMLDPLTGALLNLDQIHEMVTELMEANVEYLKDFK